MPNYFHDTITAAESSPQKMKKVNLYESPRLFCDIYCLEPGQVQKDHSHSDNDKIYHVLNGTCNVRIGSETRSLSAGELAIAPAKITHGLHNDSGNRATILVVMAPHPDFKG